jgi:RNA polymerase sigma factor (sigma-70 family)
MSSPGLMRTEDELHGAQLAHVDVLVTQLFVEHAHLLKRNFSRICRQQDKLEDLVQEAFIVLRRALSRPTNDPIRNPIALLYTVAGHLLTDQLRREVAPNQISQPLDATVSQVPDPAMGLDEWLCRNESLRLRREIINELPAEQRRAVELRVQGLKAAEIAEEMHVSATRVYRLLRLALERCQRRWRESGIDDEQ